MPKVLKAGIVLFFLFAMTTSGFGQLRRIAFFINGAGFFPSQDKIAIGYGSGMGGVFYFSSNISVSLEWKYSRFSAEKEEGRFLDGTLTITPLVASFRYNFALSEKISPYVFVGGGYFL